MFYYNEMDKRRIDTVLTPLLLPLFTLENKTAVVIDVLRATTSMCTALAHGASMIIPLASREEAAAMAERGYIVAGERGGVKLPYATLGNSPLGFTRERVLGEEIVYCSTNGTKAVVSAERADAVLIGSFVNLTAVTQHIINDLHNDVVFLCSGWKGNFNIEDTVCAGAMASQLLESEDFVAETDATCAAIALWDAWKRDLIVKAQTLEHWRRLASLGEGAGCAQCFEIDAFDVVPQYAEGRIFPSPVSLG
jgi:hypothetical protein